jgi:hypothetical protein
MQKNQPALHNAPKRQESGPLFPYRTDMEHREDSQNESPIQFEAEVLDGGAKRR